MKSAYRTGTIMKGTRSLPQYVTVQVVPVLAGYMSRTETGTYADPTHNHDETTIAK